MILGKVLLALLVAVFFMKILKKIVHAAVLGVVAYFIFQYFM